MSLDRLPIFPLPEVSLFPSAFLPLHVFEPRYRLLTRDVLAGDRRLGLCCLAPGFEKDYDGRPPVRPLGSLGEIVAHDELPGGRYNILVRGLARIRLVEELPPTEPYRLVRAEALPDHYRPGVDLALGRQALVNLCDRLADVLPSGGSTLRALAHQQVDPAATVDVVAAALCTQPADRQALLELLDVSARLERVSDHVAALLQRFHGSGPDPAAN